MSLPPIVIVNEEPPPIVIVATQGPAGSQGPTGPQGPPGTGGGGGSYTHAQAVPDTVWTVAHGLGFYPNVTVVDSSGRQVDGDVEYLDGDTVRLTFTAAFSGVAYLS